MFIFTQLMTLTQLIYGLHMTAGIDIKLTTAHCNMYQVASEWICQERPAQGPVWSHEEMVKNPTQ